MNDLHCHILPGIDDGAKTVQDSLKLLRAEAEQGVEKIVFTPHFKPKKESIDDFIVRREKSLKLLTENKEFLDLGISVKVGAEVYFSVSLADMDLDSLCYADTNYVLIELPVQVKPHGLMYMLDNVINRGYTPIIAHVERYEYISKNPTMLCDLLEKGCLAHINAKTVLDKGKSSAMALKYIKWGLVQFVCSDCHSLEQRPPNLKDAFSVIESRLGNRYAQQLMENSELIFCGKELDLSGFVRPKHIFGIWI